MKQIFSTVYVLSIGIMLLTFQSCKKTETYKLAPNRVFVVLPSTPGASTFANSTSVKKTVPNGVARVYLNQISTKDVTVSFNFGGTAVPDVNYAPPASSSVTVPAGDYYADIAFTVINSSSQTTTRTIIITLSSANNDYEVGLGTAFNYKSFTYSITP